MTNSVFGAMANRAAQLGQARAAGYAHGNRTFQVQLTRESGPPGFDRATAGYITPTPTVVYTGPARVTPMTPSQIINLGDVEASFGAIRCSIDITPNDPKIDDDIEILEDDAGQAKTASMTGKHFRVTGITEGGLMSIGYSLEAVGLRPSMFAGTNG